MPIHIDDDTARRVDELGEPKTATRDATQANVRADLASLPSSERSFRERLLEFYEEFPLPKATGLTADKAFFDEMSGGFD